MTRIETASRTVVAMAMGVVATAAAVALYQHAGLPGPVAATAALAAYLLLLTAHAFIWRGERRAAEKPVDRREQELRRLNERARQAPQPMPPAARAPLPPSAPMRPSAPLGAAPFAAELAPPAPQPAPPQPQRHAERAALPPLPPAPPANGPRTSTEGLSDFLSFRPSQQDRPDKSLPPFVTGRVAARPATEPALSGVPPLPPAPVAVHPSPARHQAPMPPPAPEASAPREADVEVIQDAIKRLLEEVNAAEQQEARTGAAAASPPPLPHPDPQGSVDRSVDALRMTAGTMRSALGATPLDADPFAGPPTPRAQVSAPPPLPPFVRQSAPARPASAADIRARQMADAISAGRIDVSLEPILGLEDQQTRHYEVTVRLRDADGAPIGASGDGPDLRGTGLLPLFDGVRISRTAAVARRLEERGKGGSVFSAFSGESVADEHFLGELAETLHQRASLATQLVLSFTQSDVRAFSTPEWDSLADMRALGFRFALSAITDLEMDFEALAEQGFAFVKLDASVFLEGLPAPSGRLPSSDVCRHLARHGLTLVVERIDDDEKLARVFGFGVLLGQGQLFGGARPVRADVVASRKRGTTAAA